MRPACSAEKSAELRRSPTSVGLFLRPILFLQWPVLRPAFGGSGHGSPETIPTIGAQFNFGRFYLRSHLDALGTPLDLIRASREFHIFYRSATTLAGQVT